MPFINSALVRIPPPPIVIILDQLLIVSCDTIITLHATIENPLASYEYQWEQLSGLTVTWLTPTNELTVMYEQTPVRDDKVFRLYVNMGSSGQEYAEILVSATPRDSIPEIKNSNFTALAFNGAGRQKPYALQEVAVATQIPGLSAPGTVTVNNPTRGVMFPEPSVPFGSALPLDNFISNFKAYDVTGGASPTLLGTFYPPARGFFGFPRERTVRVDTTVEFPVTLGFKNTHVAEGIPAGFFPPPTWSDMDNFDPAPVHLVGAGTLTTTVGRVSYTTFAEIYTDSPPSATVSLTNVPTPLNYTYTKYWFTLGSVPTQSDNNDVHLTSCSHFTVTVAREDLGIGGLGGL